MTDTTGNSRDETNKPIPTTGQSGSTWHDKAKRDNPKDSWRGEDSGRDRSPSSHRQERKNFRAPREEKPAPVHNPADLRSANRPDRGRSPNIDDDVTGKELDKGVLRQLGALEEQNRTWVQKHLVMAGRLLEEDPELAFQHALAASRRGGRLAVVREAVGMTAYGAGHFSEALREFRTYRRISGDHSHLPEMVDAERALGHIRKALELAAEAPLDKLPAASRVELAIVVSGIHLDRKDPAAALRALEISELNPRRGFDYSPRLFTAYSLALEAAGRSVEARQWANLAKRAQRALGLDIEPDPEIVDLGVQEDALSPSPRARDVVPPAEGKAQDDVATEGK